MNRKKLIAYGKGITNVGIHTENGTTSHIEDFDKVNRSNLIELYNVRQNKDEIYMRINLNRNFNGYIANSYSNYGRLELRSKRIGNSIEYEFLELWFDRLDKAAMHFEEVQQRFNRNMAQLYLEDLAKKKKDREFLSVNRFLMTRKDYIFTSSQMKELLIAYDDRLFRR